MGWVAAPLLRDIEAEAKILKTNKCLTGSIVPDKGAAMSTLFCGVDFHKNTCTLVTVDQAGKQQGLAKNVKTDRLILELSNRKGPLVVGIESSGGVNHMVDKIKALGHDVRIINSNKSRAIGYGGKKTDKKDAEMIARLLRADFAPLVTHRSQSARDMSLLITARGQLVSTRTSLICHIRGLLREYGIVMNSGVDTFYREAATSLKRLKANNPILAEVLEGTYAQVLEMKKSAESIEAKIEAMQAECEVSKRLRSIPGVGLLGAYLMIAVVDDISRFPNAKSFASYLGLVPRENSSGDHRRLGSISKSGNETLRQYLIHGARSVLSSKKLASDPNHQWGKRIEARKGINKATVALAHKMARVAFAVIRDGSEYGKRSTQATQSQAA